MLIVRSRVVPMLIIATGQSSQQPSAAISARIRT
jgi:hypothetical protein